MFDELFGRADLKERIETLEDKTTQLNERLEAERKRRKDAVTDRQAAERRVNELEDKVTQLQDRIERLQAGERSLEYRRRERLSPARVEAVFDRLLSIEGDEQSILTAVIADGHEIPQAVRDGFDERAALVSRAAPCLAVTDDAGLVSVAFDVPNPPEPFTKWDDSVDIERSWFEPAGQFTLALVRSDLFAMGVYEGRTRTAFHGFDSELKSNHSKGGFSQSRFERIRDGQIDTHLGRCQEALKERPADAPLFVVGEQSVLGAVADAADATAAVDATGDPEPALDRAFESFWTVTMYGV